jgi:SAM-dependent methyltransferase
MPPTRSELLEIAHARLYPSLRNPNYLVLRSRRLIFESYIRTLPDNLAILDIGGRIQPYRPLLEGKIAKYFALDVQDIGFVNVVGSGDQIPFRDGIFDLVVATEVFPYIRHPDHAAAEIHRVLKPGGSALLSVAAVAPRFGDDEYWRFLPRGLHALFGTFSQATITPEVSSIGGFCRLLNLGFHDFLKFQALKAIYEWTVCPVINLLGLALEHARLTSNDQWTGNYNVIAVK